MKRNEEEALFFKITNPLKKISEYEDELRKTPNSSKSFQTYFLEHLLNFKIVKCGFFYKLLIFLLKFWKFSELFSKIKILYFDFELLAEIPRCKLSIWMEIVCLFDECFCLLWVHVATFAGTVLFSFNCYTTR